MKKLRFLLIVVLMFSVLSCGSDDDICLSGEATPRMKLKFKTKSTGKLRTLDSLFVNVDYGNGPVSVIAATVKTDSVLIPLRVDDAISTTIYAGLSRATVNSQIKFEYTTKSEYVSPACGIKRLYENVSAQTEVANEIIGTEQNQTSITDESKTHFFLLF